MAFIPPTPPQVPFGPGAFGPSIWPQFNALVAEFMALLEAGELEAAGSVLMRILGMAAGRAALMEKAAELVVALRSAWAALGIAAEITAGGITLTAAGGWIAVFAIVAIFAIGGGSQPVYADEMPGRGPGGGPGSVPGGGPWGNGKGKGPVKWHPHRIKRSEEWDRIERLLFSHPVQAVGVIHAPKARPISPKLARTAGLMIARAASKMGR